MSSKAETFSQILFDANRFGNPEIPYTTYKKREAFPANSDVFDSRFLSRFYGQLGKTNFKQFYDKDKRIWTPWYLEKLNKVDEACGKYEVCEHGENHVLHVAKNALALKDMVLNEVKKGNPRLLKAGKWQEELSDSSLILFSLIHDIGYGDPNAVFKDRAVKDHPERSMSFLGYKQQEEVFRENGGFLRKAIKMSTEKAVEQANKLFKKEDVIAPKELFPILVKLADALDYPRAERVGHIKESPKDLNENRYYFIAKAVESYDVVHENGEIVYKVKLDSASTYPTVNGNKRFDFATWFDCSTKDPYCSNAWKLADRFGRLLGKEFKVREKGGQY